MASVSLLLMVKRTFLELLNDIYMVMTRLILRRLTIDDDFINSLLIRGVSIELARNLPSSALSCLTSQCAGTKSSDW